MGGKREQKKKKKEGIKSNSLKSLTQIELTSGPQQPSMREPSNISKVLSALKVA